MTPIDRVIMVDGNTDLTREKILSLSGPQYSRLPVFMDQRDNVVGLLLAHDLVPVAASVDETVRFCAVLCFVMSQNLRMAFVANSHDSVVRFQKFEMSCSQSHQEGCLQQHPSIPRSMSSKAASVTSFL